ncbi:hypothetical protein LJ655_12280 [Paraburkholderia sp. MMS20-SJTN17]|uniref:Uncharacterized protein n=1 Tax=Paraburkholderia translucens TaxID=2886945 RepID=A0ABS8KDY8_9BURK|nr:hypothetical protein [Paraburkholderia sp. MMS20-SJTN17]MCC8402659.1 hypothetical protein [Paraburkholderia sp. MMS20-SJTN17]
MADLKTMRVRSTAACVLICMSLLTHAETSAHSATVPHATEPEISASEDVLSTRPFVGDDPVAIRDALADQSFKANSPSLSDRIRKLIHVPASRAPSELDSPKASLERDLAFVVPVPYGIRYQSKTHLLTVDVDLSDGLDPGVILLKKTVTGQRGRGLVVAPEAKAKGYIQHIDLIELKSGKRNKAMVHGRVPVSQAAFSEANGDFAIVLMCSMEPPYLTDRREHSDPSNDEPTDITTRTSTLYANIHAIWLVSPQRDIVLSKKLHLSK